jgi:DNA-binding transcriptional MerR regulator
MTEEQLLIGELARRAGVTVRTIRYYISEGLLPAPSTKGRYTAYDDSYVARIRLIQQWKKAYLPLREIRARLAILSDDDVQAELARLGDDPTAIAESAEEYVEQVMRPAFFMEEQPPSPRMLAHKVAPPVHFNQVVPDDAQPSYLMMSPPEPAPQQTESWQRIPDGGPWKLSTPLTRGTSNLPLKLNEAFSRGTDTDPDWVELYNSCADTLDISGYKVYDNGGQAGTKPKKEVPAGTKLAPKGFLVIVVDKTGADSDFGLGSGGDKVWLEDAVGAVIDSVEFGALETTQSWARKPDAGLWQLSTIITKGFTNGDPTGVATAPRVVEGYLLTQNYPNPFNPSTRIDFTLPRQAEVQVAVYNLRGEMVAELVNGRLAAGSHQLTFNAEGLASGIYIYTIRSGEFTAAKRMVLMK